ncbi:unnamed protein product [Hymenolepis diminuta]|uniref:Sushi domain-containing protein n=1 Tax=Hymenolepis diminuta TaxID=6216 RepID=A0A0R3SU38_HYMDI|nr:unnamed protein product [Hymenolepis diminuta]
MTILVFEAKGQQIYPDDFPCEDSKWIYHPSTGKCYKLASASQPFAPADAKKKCGAIMQGYPAVTVSVVEIRTAEELKALKSVLIEYSLKEKINLGARRISAQNPFVWESDQKEVDFSFLPWIGNLRTGDCLVMYYTNVYIGNVKRCENPPGGFDSATMKFTPTEPYPGTTTRAVCKTGFFQRHSSGTTQYASVYKCVGIKCELDLKTLCHVELNSVGYPDKTAFKYGENITLQCIKGFGYALDLFKTTAIMECLSVPEKPDLGIWFPGPCHACSVIRCNETQMKNMVPDHAALTGARSEFTGEEYGPLQMNQFNQYGNIVTYSCDDSFFFEDWSFQKTIECTLKSGSESEGEWIGYGRTRLPLPKACQPVTCKYEDILLKPIYNIRPNFTIEFSNGTVEYGFKLRPVLYPYMTKIQYVCENGYETVTKYDVQNITCGPTARWKPQLTGCIKKEEAMKTSSGGRYVPPTVEVPSAEKLGLLMMTIIVLFFLTLLLLDLTTLHRDIRWFFNNVRLQKRLWVAKRRLQNTKAKAKI